LHDQHEIDSTVEKIKQAGCQWVGL